MVAKITPPYKYACICHKDQNPEWHFLYDSAMHWHNEATVGDAERTNYFSMIVLVRSSCCRKSIVGGIVKWPKNPHGCKDKQVEECSDWHISQGSSYKQEKVTWPKSSWSGTRINPGAPKMPQWLSNSCWMHSTTYSSGSSVRMVVEVHVLFFLSLHCTNYHRQHYVP